MKMRSSLLAIIVLVGLPAILPAQILVPHEPGSGRAIYPPIRPPIHPIPRPIPWPVPTTYRVRSVDVRAEVRDQVAKVRLSQVFQNTGSATLEAQFLFPIPDDAAISDLMLLYDGKELPGRLLTTEEARRIYEDIVRRRRDPALLEYVGRGLFKTSVFPIPPHADRTVEIRYTQLLKKTAGLVDFLLPLGTFKHGEHAIEKLEVALRLQTQDPIKSVYSPTHSVDVERPDDRHAVCKLKLDNVAGPNDLRILYGTQSGPVGMSLVSYRPSEKEDGYFMLLASPELPPARQEPAPKTVAIVVDRSGSMSGEKIEQVRQAVKFLLDQLKPNDTFNIVAYDSEVEAFRPELQRVTPETLKAAQSFAAGLNAGGGTNIHGALTTALGMLTDRKRPSYVLFLTDGMPTVGEQSEFKIVAAAKEADKTGARVFNFGVGYDVNSRLLDRLSRELKGQSFYVRPNENIEARVSTLAKTIAAPLLTDVRIKFDLDQASSATTPEAISRTYPRQLTDLFAGEQLVWVGRYRKAGHVKVSLSGAQGGARQTFTLSAELVERSVGEGNGFVEKVWATRSIGELIDELDLHGQNRELIDELVQLSMKHGILTPYTSFLADEHVDLANRPDVQLRTERSLGRLEEREGQDAFGQRMAKGHFKGAAQAPAQGYYLAVPAPASQAANGGSGFASISPSTQASTRAQTQQATVLNLGQKTFYRRNNRWEDAEATASSGKDVVHIKQFSDEYFELASRSGGKFAKYLAVNAPSLVNIEDRTYAIEPAGE